MSLVKVASVTLLASAALFASEGSHGQTDIIPRAVNFLIFAALVYYLLADKVKAFFADRTASIAKKYEEAENKIKETEREVITMTENFTPAKAGTQRPRLSKEEYAEKMKAEKEADEKVAKAKAKADKEATRAKAKNDKALKVTSEKQAKLVKEKAKADQKVQFARDVKKTFTGH